MPSPHEGENGIPTKWTSDAMIPLSVGTERDDDDQGAIDGCFSKIMDVMYGNGGFIGDTVRLQPKNDSDDAFISLPSQEAIRLLSRRKFGRAEDAGATECSVLLIMTRHVVAEGRSFALSSRRLVLVLLEDNGGVCGARKDDCGRASESGIRFAQFLIHRNRNRFLLRIFGESCSVIRILVVSAFACDRRMTW